MSPSFHVSFICRRVIIPLPDTLQSQHGHVNGTFGRENHEQENSRGDGDGMHAVRIRHDSSGISRGYD
ncbi:hypothetical protein BBJK_00373 [Bifidobacterium bifidum LMG 13195]|uniref:Uncharacterized protein n=1 Tax=Bifidobacterium bifidum LMG 13195 TaxID=1207542 RepID=A0A286TA70_BIFBI|nr:hypothetical protein BBJK_00373 [Bifidobacterium bifidum LMG 13195]